jgi:4-hydroxythreonine-4-phosphate dehydrogenase
MTLSGLSAPLALTMGEPSGIGGEITLKAWLRRNEGIDPFFLIDDPARIACLAKELGLAVPVAAIDAPEAAVKAFPQSLPVLVNHLPAVVRPGRPTRENAGAVIGSIERAVEFALNGRAVAVVTNPVHKATLMAAGFPFAGQTEFLAQLSGVKRPVVMMLVCPQLRTVPVTRHLALREALAALDTDSIVEQAKMVAAALIQDFGILKPRLAVAALNPHGGEFGHEEADIIAPAIAALRAAGIIVEGPVPADALFRHAARGGYDAAICMYHDQALIPIKALDFDHGVNVTLGLPFVRSSPDHGTALSLAGRGKASESSLVAAILLAGEMAARRRARDTRSIG